MEKKCAVEDEDEKINTLGDGKEYLPLIFS